MILGILIANSVLLLLIITWIWQQKSQQQQKNNSLDALSQRVEQLEQQQDWFADRLFKDLTQLREQLHQQQLQQQQQHSQQLLQFEREQKQQQSIQAKTLLTELNQVSSLLAEQTKQHLQQQSEQVQQRIDQLTQTTQQQLQHISQQVEQRLTQGFEKTLQTFHAIQQRLSLIDDAQQKMTQLSAQVVNLQQVLSDKRSRGAFGEIQLNILLANMLPRQHYQLQHKFTNEKIADCLLLLPPPTGDIVIDAKFPLESYRILSDTEQPVIVRQHAIKQFKQDMKKHIQDIANKYILPPTTSDGAILFLPAEAVFAEIHAHHPDVLQLAYQKRVWITSPTTLMAILTTVKSVLKDEATKEQLHVIQHHLLALGTDFKRFQQRFNQLAKHIDQAASDVKQIHTSATKISQRFDDIEQVELVEENQ